LQLEAAQQAAASDSDDEEQKDQDSEQCCSQAEVLLVDDQPFNLMPLELIIQGKFHKKCDKAENGQIAVEMYLASMQKTCCEQRYRAVLTDIQMPILDGISASILIFKHQE